MKAGFLSRIRGYRVLSTTPGSYSYSGHTGGCIAIGGHPKGFQPLGRVPVPGPEAGLTGTRIMPLNIDYLATYDVTIALFCRASK